ncbi:MAG: YdcF family protein [Robiginitomaculum sp.]|nr:YdcF family protein [Robiginitomaculum sp.]
MKNRDKKRNLVSKSKSRMRRALYKIAKFTFGFAASLILAGFAVFLVKVSTAKPPANIPPVDGIVVLTGADGSRLIVGAALLQNGHGERLLISGVNKTITPAQIQALLGMGDAKFTCCVDLDYQAENTFDNGYETSVWARALGYEKILLVTSAYHMPRAKLEIDAAMDGISIIAYPVHIKSDWSWWRKTRLLVREYGKLLVSLAREPGARNAHQPLSENQAPVENVIKGSNQ